MKQLLLISSLLMALAAGTQAQQFGGDLDLRIEGGSFGVEGIYTFAAPGDRLAFTIDRLPSRALIVALYGDAGDMGGLGSFDEKRAEVAGMASHSGSNSFSAKFDVPDSAAGRVLSVKFLVITSAEIYETQVMTLVIAPLPADERASKGAEAGGPAHEQLIKR